MACPPQPSGAATLFSCSRAPEAAAASERMVPDFRLASLSGEAIRKLGLAPQTHFFIEKMMAKEVDVRYQSWDELIRYLLTGTR